MPAYLIAAEHIHDTAIFDEYRKQVLPNIQAFGGRFLSRGAQIHLLETDHGFTPERAVIIEFPSLDALNAWYNSDEYAPIRALRHKAARTTIIAMDAGGAA